MDNRKNFLKYKLLFRKNSNLFYIDDFLENFSIIWNKKRMDDIDRKLLTLLQVNADLPLSEIAKRVGISSTPCWNRIKKLEEQGVIKYKVSLVDKEKVGYAVTVFSLSQ